jgi:hypothetical protein
MKRIVPLLGLVFVLISVSCGSATGTETATTLSPPAKDKIYFGAFPDFGGAEETVTAKRIHNFESIAGKKILWACFSNNWWHGIHYPKTKIHTIADTGTIPYVRLMPRSDEEPGHVDQTFTLQRIIDGNFDNDLKQWARDAKADAIPLMIDFGVEMNGDWFPWSGIFNGGKHTDGYGNPHYPDGPERYRDAYRHIIELFWDVGVRHVTWVFHYNYATLPYEAWNKPHYYYPGDDYIDWVGFSLYGAQTPTEEWQGLEFSTQLKDYSDDFEAIKTNNPIALFEFGVTDDHPEGNKSAWLEDAFDSILDNPYVHFSAISYWHENWQNEDETNSTLRLDSSVEVQKTFRRRIADERFVSSPQQ